MVVMGVGKPVRETVRREREKRKAERRHSRFVLSVIVVVSIVVPICVTFLFIGSDRAQGYAILALAFVVVALGFLPLLRPPLDKSLQSQPGDRPSIGAGGFHGY
jgi:hypothetical protein